MNAVDLAALLSSLARLQLTWPRCSIRWNSISPESETQRGRRDESATVFHQTDFRSAGPTSIPGPHITSLGYNNLMRTDDSLSIRYNTAGRQTLDNAA
jgi:hypothetical protein